MIFVLHLFFFSILLLLLQKSLAQCITGRYVVVFKKNATAEAINQHYASIKGDIPECHIKARFHHLGGGFRGYAFQFPNPANKTGLGQILKKVSGCKEVETIEQGQYFSKAGIQSDPPSWGLQRISSKKLVKFPTNAGFSYPDSAGQGVKVFVVDSGCNCHPDFCDRLKFTYCTADNCTLRDLDGHGTHVAGIVGGKIYGVAKKAQLECIKVDDNLGRSTTTDILKAFDHISNLHVSPAIINLSMTAGPSLSLQMSIEHLESLKIYVVTSAGNDGKDACNYAPGNSPDVINVGMTNYRDERQAMSNYGNCVAVFAPGAFVVSANATNYKAPATLSGTSQAAPHVAGLLAVMFKENPQVALKGIAAVKKEFLKTWVVPNIVKDARGPNSGMIYSSCQPKN